MARAEAAAEPPSPTIAVEVCVALDGGRVLCLPLVLPAASTVADALRAAELGAHLDADAIDRLATSIWGRACRPSDALRERDRIELTRPLRVDPKEARRQRYRRDGLKRRPAPARA